MPLGTSLLKISAIGTQEIMSEQNQLSKFKCCLSRECCCHSPLQVGHHLGAEGGEITVCSKDQHGDNKLKIMPAFFFPIFFARSHHAFRKMSSDPWKSKVKQVMMPNFVVSSVAAHGLGC